MKPSRVKRSIRRPKMSQNPYALGNSGVHVLPVPAQQIAQGDFQGAYNQLLGYEEADSFLDEWSLVLAHVVPQPALFTEYLTRFLDRLRADKLRQGLNAAMLHIIMKNSGTEEQVELAVTQLISSGAEPFKIFTAKDGRAFTWRDINVPSDEWFTDTEFFTTAVSVAVQFRKFRLALWLAGLDVPGNKDYVLILAAYQAGRDGHLQMVDTLLALAGNITHRQNIINKMQYYG